MTELANEPTILLFHAEMVPPTSFSIGDKVQESSSPFVSTGSQSNYSTFLASRPPSFETCAISEILNLAPLAPRLSLHIVHLSAQEAFPLLRAARAAGIPITAETCPHYLALTAESVPDGDTRHKCCPPIRNAANQDALWAELTRPHDSVIQTVVSDHSPCTPNLKLLPATIPGAPTPTTPSAPTTNITTTVTAAAPLSGDFFAAWGGVSSVGLGLSILWTAGLARHAITLLDVAAWCCARPAAQVGLAHRKGALAVGLDADVAVFDPTARFVVTPKHMRFRHPCSPYHGRELVGVVHETWLRGRKIYVRGGEGEGAESEVLGPWGELLLEPRV